MASSIDYKTLYSLREAARELDCVRSTIYSWAADGIIRTVTVGGRRYIPGSELQRLANQGVDK